MPPTSKMTDVRFDSNRGSPVTIIPRSQPQARAERDAFIFLENRVRLTNEHHPVLLFFLSLVIMVSPEGFRWNHHSGTE